jgi:hypothetical protein
MNKDERLLADNDYTIFEICYIIHTLSTQYYFQEMLNEIMKRVPLFSSDSTFTPAW